VSGILQLPRRYSLVKWTIMSARLLYKLKFHLIISHTILNPLGNAVPERFYDPDHIFPIRVLEVGWRRITAEEFVQYC
jgi:hypothetical protein